MLNQLFEKYLGISPNNLWGRGRAFCSRISRLWLPRLPAYDTACAAHLGQMAEKCLFVFIL